MGWAGQSNRWFAESSAPLQSGQRAVSEAPILNRKLLSREQWPERNCDRVARVGRGKCFSVLSILGGCVPNTRFTPYPAIASSTTRVWMLFIVFFISPWGITPLSRNGATVSQQLDRSVSFILRVAVVATDVTRSWDGWEG